MKMGNINWSSISRNTKIIQYQEVQCSQVIETYPKVMPTSSGMTWKPQPIVHQFWAYAAPFARVHDVQMYRPMRYLPQWVPPNHLWMIQFWQARSWKSFGKVDFQCLFIHFMTQESMINVGRNRSLINSKSFHRALHSKEMGWQSKNFS